jgi:hypothetical protein
VSAHRTYVLNCNHCALQYLSGDPKLSRTGDVRAAALKEGWVFKMVKYINRVESTGFQGVMPCDLCPSCRHKADDEEFRIFGVPKKCR